MHLEEQTLDEIMENSELLGMKNENHLNKTVGKIEVHNF